MDNDARIKQMRPVSDLLVEAVQNEDQESAWDVLKNTNCPALLLAQAEQIVTLRKRVEVLQEVETITRGITPIGMSKARAVQIVRDASE